jgi:hypothetical protein
MSFSLIVAFGTAEWKWDGISIHNPSNFNTLSEIMKKRKTHLAILTKDG